MTKWKLKVTISKFTGTYVSSIYKSNQLDLEDIILG